MRKKIMIGFGILIFLIALVSAVELKVIYNPFTGKFDYYSGSNFTGDNVTASYFCLLNDICIETWPAGSASAGDKWVDGGTFIYPNSTFADNVIVYGYIKAEDWTNVTITESQITDLTHTGNASWNQSLADTLYAPNTTEGIQYLINGTGVYSTYNETYAGLINNASYLSTFNQTYHDYVALNTSNKSYFWDDLDTINTTQMENNGGILNLLESWLSTLFTDTDTKMSANPPYLSNDSTSISFNETKLNETISDLGVDLGFNSTYNATYEGSVNNASYLSTYNQTYHDYVILNKSNSTYFWDDYDSANATQMENSGGVLNILESWIDGLWCRLTGCTISGNLNVTGVLNVTSNSEFQGNVTAEGVKFEGGGRIYYNGTHTVIEGDTGAIYIS